MATAGAILAALLGWFLMCCFGGWMLKRAGRHLKSVNAKEIRRP
jgi:hypothetical protein